MLLFVHVRPEPRTKFFPSNQVEKIKIKKQKCPKIVKNQEHRVREQNVTRTYAARTARPTTTTVVSVAAAARARRGAAGA